MLRGGPLFLVFDCFTLGHEEASLSVNGSVNMGSSKGVSANSNDVVSCPLPTGELSLGRLVQPFEPRCPELMLPPI